jgi:GlcNAc-P-P-Und epimerase
MKVAVIGGAGFIGSYFVKTISDEHTVYIIDKVKPASFSEKITSIQADVRDLATLQNVFPEGVDLVVLLAAEHRDDVHPVSLYYDVNVEGTRNVLKVMAAKNVNKIIFTSSVSVYGLNKDNPDETSPTDPFNHYGKSKLKAEEILRKWFESSSSERTLIILRPTVVFGPGNKGNVYNLLTQISSGKFIMIGQGKNKKSMAYVGNIAEFLKYCVNSHMPGFHLYNYVDKPDLSTKELVLQAENTLGKKILPLKIPYFVGYAGAKVLDVASKVLNKKFSISAVRVKKFCATTQFNSINLNSTNFKPPYDLEEALEITIKDIIVEDKSKAGKLVYSSE